jgi:hypothetical protein
MLAEPDRDAASRVAATVAATVGVASMKRRDVIDLSTLRAHESSALTESTRATGVQTPITSPMDSSGRRSVRIRVWCNDENDAIGHGTP